MIISNLLGWVGTILLLLAYFLLSTNKLKANSKIYQILNLLGALGIILNTLTQKAWPAMALNIVWAVIAVQSLVFQKK